jgi:RsiW-degrading membrane proteinase PrsW (M82 family)
MRALLLLCSLLPLCALLLLLRAHQRAHPADTSTPQKRWLLIALLWGGIVAPHGALLTMRAFAHLSIPIRNILYAPLVEEAFKAGGLLLLSAAASAPTKRRQARPPQAPALQAPAPQTTPTPLHAFWFGVTLGVGFATTENILALLASPPSPLPFLILRFLLPTLMHTLTATLLATLPALAPSRDDAARWLLLPLLAFGCAVLLHSAHNGIALTLSSPISISVAAFLPLIALYTLSRLHHLAASQSTHAAPT